MAPSRQHGAGRSCDWTKAVLGIAYSVTWGLLSRDVGKEGCLGDMFPSGMLGTSYMEPFSPKGCVSFFVA